MREWEREAPLFPSVAAVAVRAASTNGRTKEQATVLVALSNRFKLATETGEMTGTMRAPVMANVFLMNVLSATLAWSCAPASAPGDRPRGCGAHLPRRRARAHADEPPSHPASWLALPLVGTGCSDFSTARVTPPRATFGAELYSVLCERVGAQALREDVTGASFQAVCNPDANGNYATKVDQSLLPPLTATTTPAGQPVSLAVQQQHRALDVARVEALARDRIELVAAFDATLPATTISELPLAQGECPDPDAAAADASGRLSLQKEFSALLARIVDLYNDDTIPFATRALGDVMNEVKADPDLQDALARVDARQGYRPLPLAVGVARPALAYPRLVEMSRAVFGVLLADAPAPGGEAFTQSQLVLYNELRTPSTTPPLSLLTSTPDPDLGGRLVLGRPRSFLESIRLVALTENAAFSTGNPTYVVQPRPARLRLRAARRTARFLPPSSTRTAIDLPDVTRSASS